MVQGGLQKTMTRERILREAATLLRASGPHAMRISDVMARAGLTHGGFYAHFRSKDELVSETITDMFARTHAVFMASLGHPDAAATFRTFVNDYLSMKHRNAAERVCPLPPLAGYVTWLSEGSRQRFETGLRSLAIGVSTILHRLGRAEHQSEARSIVSEMVGAMALARTIARSDEAEEHLAYSRQAILARTGTALPQGG